MQIHRRPADNVRMRFGRPCLPSLALAVLLVSLTSRGAGAESESDVDYASEIKPLLRDKCFACHSALKQEAGLRLDAAGLIREGGDSGSAYVAGSADKSLIVQRVTADDEERMPPAEAGPRLTADEVAKLSAWIDSGAAAPDEPVPDHPSRHWAFLPPVKAEVPAVSADWVRNEIDRFLAAEHQRIGVEAVGETSRAMLLRRASLALTGLPPTPAELEAFLDDTSETALENAVDRLLESPRYGERWARHFMDIWRYSDPSGYGKEIRDGREHIWRWRDWVVESLNEDKPYDRMVIEMLAADEAAPEDPAALRATGFLARNWYKFNRNLWLDNVVEHSSKAFLGVTVNCARCHDHKYDPFEQDGYYRMRAIFETHDVRDDPLPGSAGGSEDAPAMLVRAYDAHLERPTFPFQQGDENRPEKDRPLAAGLPELLGELAVEPVPLPVTAWYPALHKENREATLDAARREATAAASAVAQAREAVATAQKNLAEFQAPTLEHGGTPEPKAASRDGEVVLSEDFSSLDPERWKVEGGTWTAKDGRVVQSDGATEQHRLVSLTDHPRDFRARLRVRITGGETYRSVGLGFDGHQLAMNSVYLSVSGPKVQVSSQGSDGRWQYPAEGMASHPIQLGQDYVLELAVKDQLLNVLIDGDLKVAYMLPTRKPGRLSVWAFSATAQFDQLDVTTLPAETRLEAASGSAAKSPQAPTREQLQQALRVAEAAQRAALARQAAAQSAVAATKSRIAAEMAKYNLAEGDLSGLAAAAGRATRQHALDSLAEQIARAELKSVQQQQKQQQKQQTDQPSQAIDKQLAELQQKLEAAKAELDSGSADYPALGPQYPRTSSGRRLAFARWITDRNNPLAARVVVNHVWLRHFGSPLVERTFDFGLRSQKPRHAQLLDWLAVQLIEDGWSLKKLHKRMLLSGVYRRSSSPAAATAETLAADPDNHTLWRMNARRMEAEVVRDSVLRLGGSLDVTMGGPPIEHTRGQTVLRRSLYFRQDKERQMTFLSVFDGAKVNECYERKSTVAPQQALAMFNSKIAAEQARKIAEQYGALEGGELVNALFAHVLCREPTEAEQAECVRYLAEFAGGPAARAQLALVLLNHNDFVTIR